jgi:hypothetical protein
LVVAKFSRASATWEKCTARTVGRTGWPVLGSSRAILTLTMALSIDDHGVGLARDRIAQDAR